MFPNQGEKRSVVANSKLFSTKHGRGPAADTVNQAGGQAYSLDSKHALAQLVATGCLNGTYYASAKEQLDEILKLASECSPEFVAKVAIYGRKQAYMKDTPSLLVAWLAANGHGELLDHAFPKVIDNGRMLRNFSQIIRSGRLGRKSFGSRPKRLIQNWLNSQTDDQLFRASVGNDPSLADVIKMVHPKPETKSREALYGYLLGRKYNKENLPEIVKSYEAFKAGESNVPPKVEFRMLTSLSLKDDHWTKIAKDARWQMTRMNLNTFARHGVFKDEKMVSEIAARLADVEQVKRSRCFPYQLFSAFKNTSPSDVPVEVRDALQSALESSVDNIPTYPGKVWIFPDVSGSMATPVTGDRGNGSSSVRCGDVAALFTAAIMRKNPTAEVLPFANYLYENIDLNGRDSIMTNAEKMARLPGGGTFCALPLKALNDRKKKGDLLIYISDNQSWMDSYGWNSSRNWGKSTSAQNEWEKFQKRNPEAKMVCIDIQPNTTSQIKENKSVLNIGGFSDKVFDVVAKFAKQGLDAAHWVEVIEKTVEL